jgi:elongation factor G
VWPIADAPVPDDLKELAKTTRAKVIELAVEQDEEALMAYLEGVEPDIKKLKECIRKGTLAFAFTPIVTGTAFKNKGVQTLLDAIVDYMPSPLDRPPIAGVDAVNIEKAIERPSDDNAPFAALAFKIMNDPFVGTLTFTRIYSGTYPVTIPNASVLLFTLLMHLFDAIYPLQDFYPHCNFFIVVSDRILGLI